YYTVDGSDPTVSEERVLFTEPFAMSAESMNIKAVAEYNGNISDVVDFEYELKKADIDFNLAGNWNWISHNAENPVAVAEFATEGINTILSQTQEVISDPVHGLVGNLKQLEPVVGYKVFVDGNGWNGNVADIAFDPSTSVRLNSGWNWIGTPVDGVSLLIEDLLAGLKVEEGDMIVGLDGFAQVDAEGVWKGSVSQMQPGVGYMFFSNSGKEFTYNLVPERSEAVPAKAPVAALDGYWMVDNHKYASVMPVIASLESLNADDYEVAAFCGNECRGIGVPVDGLMMINVHGNAGDVITFRFINSANQEMISQSKAIFEEKPVGTFADPFVVKVGDASSVETLTIGSISVSYENGNIVLNGDLSDLKSVEVYDITGKLIANGKNTISLGNIDGNVVTVVIRKADSTNTLKLLVK
ncbi:MAG: chitobiase/beta-hexosaminidase C-terminal domain-containing protein, partial [Muribaculaceae bacterium]|nr:chitobiase/beta-hexosaminidase C-terminal domain-containing protein [Muribaculaceae bacterium]